MSDAATTLDRPYHHGDLKAALLVEAERILEAEGVQALTLRAAARGAGVSHAAPANHFGDLTGLLSELAAAGYQRFSDDLETAAGRAGEDPAARSDAMGRAYVGFARRHPHLFALMYRSERLDPERPALHAALVRARSTLRSAATGAEAPASPLLGAASAAARWSLVHGFAMLLIDGRLADIIGSLPAGEDADSLLEAVLEMTTVNA